MPFQRGKFNSWLLRDIHWQSIIHSGVQPLSPVDSDAKLCFRIPPSPRQCYQILHLQIIPLNLVDSIIIIIPRGMLYCSQGGLGKRCQLGKNKTKPTQIPGPLAGEWGHSFHNHGSRKKKAEQPPLGCVWELERMMLVQKRK